jgi:hypothetical protein
MFSQISILRSVPTEAWAALAAAAGAVAVIAKKLISRKSPPPKPDPVTRSEFHHELNLMRDRIGASYLAIADKIDANHRELLAALDHQVTRINHLETDVARIDERTRI